MTYLQDTQAGRGYPVAIYIQHRLGYDRHDAPVCTSTFTQIPTVLGVSVMTIYYEPAGGRCGDFVPFWWAGRYHLYHIQDRGWEHLSTSDMVHFEEHPTAIAGRGGG